MSCQKCHSWICQCEPGLTMQREFSYAADLSALITKINEYLEAENKEAKAKASANNAEENFSDPLPELNAWCKTVKHVSLKAHELKLLITDIQTRLP